MVTRQEFKPDLVSQLSRSTIFSLARSVVAFVPKASTGLTFHSKCINPLYSPAYCTLPAPTSPICLPAILVQTTPTSRTIIVIFQNV